MEVSAATAWPFALGGELAERMAWSTDFMPPQYGQPTTRRLRKTPRTFLQFDGLEERDTRRWMDHAITANAAGLWHCPLAGDAGVLGASASASATSLVVDTDGRRFADGGNAILIGADPRQHEVVEIETVGSGTLSLAEPLANNWPAWTRILPTVGAHMTSAPTMTRFTADATPYSVEMRAFEPLAWPDDFGGTTYRDLPVFELQAGWTTDPTYAPLRATADLDYGIGAARPYDQGGMPLPAIRFPMELVGREAIGTFRSLLYALCGRWKPIWVPSLGQDMRLVAQQSSTVLDIAWMGYADTPLMHGRRDIRIDRYGAAPVYRRVTSTANVDAATERIVLDTALPGGFDIADVYAVSFMALCLQDADVNVMRVWDHDVALSELAFKGFVHEL